MIAISIGGLRRFPPLVRRTIHGALERFFGRVRGQHAERHRHAGGAGGGGQPVRDRRGDVLEVRRRAANQAAEAHDAVELVRVGRKARRRRDLERSGHADDRDVVVAHAEVCERRERSLLQPVGHEVVVLRDDHGELESAGRPRSFDDAHLLSLESRLPLLEKRARAFAHVVGRSSQSE